MSLGSFVQNVANRVQNAVSDAAAYQERLLSDREAQCARQVFNDTVPYGRVWFSNGTGFNQRPYTVPHPRKPRHYIIHVGPDPYQDLTNGYKLLLIHELTHVWQGEYRGTPVNYICDSVISQFKHKNSAYRYTAGNDWASYNAEQQASIVEDWFANGMLTSSNLFRYIRDNIRAKRAY